MPPSAATLGGLRVKTTSRALSKSFTASKQTEPPELPNDA